jgi:hypothetical protein
MRNAALQPPVHMIKLTQEREITRYVWTHPDTMCPYAAEGRLSPTTINMPCALQNRLVSDMTQRGRKSRESLAVCYSGSHGFLTRLPFGCLVVSNRITACCVNRIESDSRIIAALSVASS